MGNPEHLAILKHGVEVWHRWQQEFPKFTPDLQGSDMQSVNLANADVSRPDFEEADLSYAKLVFPDFRKANPSYAAFSNTDLRDAKPAANRLDGCKPVRLQTGDGDSQWHPSYMD